MKYLALLLLLASPALAVEPGDIFEIPVTMWTTPIPRGPIDGGCWLGPPGRVLVIGVDDLYVGLLYAGPSSGIADNCKVGFGFIESHGTIGKWIEEIARQKEVRETRERLRIEWEVRAARLLMRSPTMNLLFLELTSE